MAESEPITGFGRFLRTWRWKQEPSWSKRKVALALGVATSTVWNWEHTDRVPQRDQLPKIAQITGRPIRDMYVVCGYPAPHMMCITNPKLIDYMIQSAQTDADFEPSERKQLLSDLHEMRDCVVAGALLLLEVK